MKEAAKKEIEELFSANDTLSLNLDILPVVFRPFEHLPADSYTMTELTEFLRLNLMLQTTVCNSFYAYPKLSVNYATRTLQVDDIMYRRFGS